ncbi:uncharacterized protein LOC6542943 [Drosophila erecta]|uniref:Uncharacterized protein n=1 Tax=Drosophila erecta TaxID=7220 RepID=B3N9I3_DROER|nr:uncharacterized protein LOC6542943 [Drosophila erecta]EDV57440.1 uncharacterized protein Dere_GG24842 [Drosophila erecta]
MFRAQRVCIYFVVFLVLAAARPKISSRISQNQIGLRKIAFSTEERAASQSSLSTEAASEPKTTGVPTVTSSSSSKEASEAPEGSSQEASEASYEDESSESSDESEEGSYYYYDDDSYPSYYDSYFDY